MRQTTAALAKPNLPDLFTDLSAAEASVLGTFMERLEVAPGTVLVRQGEGGDALFVIESGEAEVWSRSAAGEPTRIAALGPGEFFGEIALVTGGERIAHVIAVTAMRLVSLSREGYEQFVRHTSDMQQRLMTTAAIRASSTARAILAGN
jgi:CRP-like cAMP-binding protein